MSYSKSAASDGNIFLVLGEMESISVYLYRHKAHVYHQPRWDPGVGVSVFFGGFLSTAAGP